MLGPGFRIHPHRVLRPAIPGARGGAPGGEPERQEGVARRRTGVPPGRPQCASTRETKFAAFVSAAAAWGAFSNFQPLPVPIAAGPWTFAASESLYQACKFAVRPDVQQRIAEAPTAREAADIGRTPGLGIDPGWNAQRVDVMRWVLRLKREANEAEIDALLAATGDRPIVEVSARDAWWGAKPVAGRYEGNNVLGRLWMELRQQLRDGDAAARSGSWVDRKRDIERQIEERLHDAVGDLYRRLGEAVERVSERLQEGEDGKPLVFRNSMIENIRDLVDVVPRLNIFGDDRLALLCQDVKDRIAHADPDTLRPSPQFNPNVRRQVKRDADALIQQFGGFFGDVVPLWRSLSATDRRDAGKTVDANAMPRLPRAGDLPDNTSSPATRMATAGPGAAGRAIGRPLTETRSAAELAGAAPGRRVVGVGCRSWEWKCPGKRRAGSSKAAISTRRRSAKHGGGLATRRAGTSPRASSAIWSSC